MAPTSRPGGPRHFDCLKRVWHSDSHQPIRGTLIQEIFRVVDEVHGSATKNNKEYQEKLPTVVLKVEEILYSKANSEEEYMDLTTLSGRANDAINTIIRRDEHTEETGQYLQPCIEAALSLGCSLSKTSRSERNNIRCYLSHTTEEEVPNVVYDTAPQNANGRRENTKKTQHVFASTKNNVPLSSKKQCLLQQPPNLFSVYPLYYWNNNNIHRLEEPQHGKSRSNNTFGHAIKGVVAENLLVCNLNPSRCDTDSQPRTNECDLSLRLGPFAIPVHSFDNGEVQKDKNLEPYG